MPEYWDSTRVVEETPIDNTRALHRMVKNEQFPPPLRLTGKTYRWSQLEVQGWLRSLYEQRMAPGRASW